MLLGLVFAVLSTEPDTVLRITNFTPVVCDDVVSLCRVSLALSVAYAPSLLLSLSSSLSLSLSLSLSFTLTYSLSFSLSLSLYCTYSHVYNADTVHCNTRHHHPTTTTTTAAAAATTTATTTTATTLHTCHHSTHHDHSSFALVFTSSSRSASTRGRSRRTSLPTVASPPTGNRPLDSKAINRRSGIVGNRYKRQDKQEEHKPKKH